jgi:hypothetical protein
LLDHGIYAPGFSFSVLHHCLAGRSRTGLDLSFAIIAFSFRRMGLETGIASRAAHIWRNHVRTAIMEGTASDGVLIVIFLGDPAVLY